MSLTKNFSNVSRGSSFWNGTNTTEILWVSSFQPLHWTTQTIFSILTLITGLTGNTLLLTIFAKTPDLRTAFNIYVINLLLANLSCLLVQYPLIVASSLYNGTQFMSRRLCSLYLYSTYVLGAAVFNAHQLIAWNRVWAMVHPVSYRRLHASPRLATRFCVAMWAVVHVIVVPAIVWDAFYSVEPQVAGACYFNAPSLWVFNVFSELLLFVWPEVVMLLALPVICYARRRRRAVQDRVMAQVVPANVSVQTSTVQ